MASINMNNLLTDSYAVVFALMIGFTTIHLSSHLGAKAKRVQMLVFGLCLIGSVYYLLQASSADKTSVAVKSFFSQFVELPKEIQLAVSLAAVALTYFGCAMGTDSGGSGSGALNTTPAASDRAVDFVVPSSIPEEDKKLFEQMFTRFCDEIVADLPTVYEMPEEAVQWVDDMLKYTVAGGKMNRGLAAMSVQKHFTQAQRGTGLSNKERVQSAALGWCIEFLQAFFLVADDIMDGSVTRRGQPCWYRKDKVKLIAINDSFILESCVYKILKRYFGTEPYYGQLLDLFIEVTRQTELGQLLDLTSQPLDGPLDLSRFQMQRLKSIFKYKTAFYSFYLPVALGMIVSGVRDPTLFDQAREVLCIMGEYFQIQDDYLDCYGDEATIGKVGTDIQDSKCSWLVVTALDKCNAKQKKVIEKNYGKDDAKCIANIKKLYVQLDLERDFQEYEEQSYKEIQALLDKYSGLQRDGFEYLLNKIYKRKK